MGASSLFYCLDDPFQMPAENRKKRFVAVRMEEELFKELTTKAQETGSDLSQTIRQLCREGLR